MGAADVESARAEQYEADEEAWEQVRKIEEALKNLKASLKSKEPAPSMGGKSKKQKNAKNKKTRKQRRR